MKEDLMRLRRERILREQIRLMREKGVKVSEIALSLMLHPEVVKRYLDEA